MLLLSHFIIREKSSVGGKSCICSNLMTKKEGGKEGRTDGGRETGKREGGKKEGAKKGWKKKNEFQMKNNELKRLKENPRKISFIRKCNRKKMVKGNSRKNGQSFHSIF